MGLLDRLMVCMESPYAILSVIHESRDVEGVHQGLIPQALLWGPGVLNPVEYPSLASNSWVTLFTKSDALSDDVTAAIPGCINKSMIASHTSLAYNLFSGCTAGRRVQLSTIQRVLMAL